jgi:hypothetical protein
VLSLKGGWFTLNYYAEDDNQTCAMKLKCSFLIDPHDAARREWESSRGHKTYLSIPLTGSKRRLVLASNRAEEADFLVSSINALQLTRGAPDGPMLLSCNGSM